MKKTRREFLKEGAALGAGALVLGACSRSAAAAASSVVNSSMARPSIENAGIQLWTVRDKMTSDFEGTLARLAEIGYREVEFVGYGNRSPEAVRAILDRVGLRGPSTHVGLEPGPGLEKQLAGYQAMGHRYAAVSVPRLPGQAGGWPPPPPTLESVQHEIAVHNEVGRVAKQYGIKPLIHNHTMEFTVLPDGRTPHDVMLAELDASLVVLELDIGWATVAGQNAQSLFAAHAGRYPLWHVKDMANLAAVNAKGSDQLARMQAATIVPVGRGEIDYGSIFARSGTAGLDHFFVEQDTAVDSGDSVAAARVSFEALRNILKG